MNFKYSETAETGRMSYNPVDMFKLYSYTYFNGIRSSRKIEKETHRNIEVMWLINELKPDFKTIADFRKDNKEQIKAAFSKFSMICDELGLIGKEMIAVDGSKFRANNSRGAYYTKKKVFKILENYKESADKYLSLLEACDREEEQGATTTINRKEIVEKLKTVIEKTEKFKEIAIQVTSNGEIYLTDPDSKLMKSNDGGCEISHNVQIAVENKNHLVVVVDVTSEAVDRAQLCNISSQAKEELRLDKITVIADKGYYSQVEFAKCSDKGIIPIVSKMEHLECAATVGYAKTQFKYDEKNNVYICPQGQILKPTKKKNPDSPHNRYLNYKACKNCPAKNQCTKNEQGRSIVDEPFQRFADEVDKRTIENMELYKQRQRLAEHPFGTVKRSLGYNYFLTRRTESVRVESLLHFLVYNMKRTINIMGTRRLTDILQG
jgi:transposase